MATNMLLVDHKNLIVGRGKRNIGSKCCGEKRKKRGMKQKKLATEKNNNTRN